MYRHRHPFCSPQLDDRHAHNQKMRRSLVLSAIALLVMQVAGEETPPFNKEELEALLKKEHSQRVSNVYDSENGIQ
jgi:hypothetical protein